MATEHQRKILALFSEIEELRKQYIYTEWRKRRGISLNFSEIRLNYFELKRFLVKYLGKTKNMHLSHPITISRNQKILIQRVSNFLFSCDKFFDHREGKKNFTSEHHSFFLHLRNYVAHKAQFPLISMVSFQKYDNVRFESFSKNEILNYIGDQIESDKRKRKSSLLLAQEFTRRLDDKPDILPLIDNYYRIIEDEFSKDYLDFIKKFRTELEQFINEVSTISEKKRELNATSLAPPLRDSEIRLIRYLIKKADQF